MSKNKRKRLQIKIFIKRFFPTSTVQKCDYLKQFLYQILAYQMLFNAYERLFNALYEKLLKCYEKLHKICSNKVDVGLFVVLEHALEHVLDNLLISISESINPVITNLLNISQCLYTNK